MGTEGTGRRPRRAVALSAGFALVAASAGLVAVGRAVRTSAVSGRTRTYYIAADAVDWDYAPSGKNLLGPRFDATAGTYLDHGDERIGHVNRKSVYRQYTDGTFKTLAPRPDEWEHLGVLGPPIHAEVGDTVKVVFRNNTPFPATMHPHGLFYDKGSEGADYDDGTSG